MGVHARLIADRFSAVLHLMTVGPMVENVAGWKMSQKNGNVVL